MGQGAPWICWLLACAFILGRAVCLQISLVAEKSSKPVATIDCGGLKVRSIQYQPSLLDAPRVVGCGRTQPVAGSQRLGLRLILRGNVTNVTAKLLGVVDVPLGIHVLGEQSYLQLDSLEVHNSTISGTLVRLDARQVMVSNLTLHNNQLSGTSRVAGSRLVRLQRTQQRVIDDIATAARIGSGSVRGNHGRGILVEAGARQNTLGGDGQQLEVADNVVKSGPLFKLSHYALSDEQSSSYRHLLADTIRIQSLSWVNNTVQESQQLDGQLWCNSQSLTIVACNFADNNGTGSVLYANGTGSIQILSNTKVVGNGGNKSSSPVHVEGFSNLDILKGTFHNNTAHEIGGALNLKQVKFVQLEGVSFVGNKVVQGDGGALAVQGANDVSAKECIFDSNRAQGVGGALAFVKGGQGGGSKLRLEWSNFTNNLVKQGSGGALWVEEVDQVLLHYGDAQNNSAQFFGGFAAFFTVPGVARLHGLNLEGNEAQAQGGSLNFYQVAQVKLDNVNVTKSKSAGPVVALQVRLGTSGALLDVQNTVMSNNKVSEDGVLSVEKYQHVDVTNLRMEHNVANSSSAGFAISGCGNVTIRSVGNKLGEYSAFRNNSMVRGEGTALQVVDCGSVDLHKVEFVNNTISPQARMGAQGGAVFASGVSQGLQVKECHFEGNRGQQGGAVFIKSSCIPKISGSQLVGNEAYDAGGGLWMEFSDPKDVCDSLTVPGLLQLGFVEEGEGLLQEVGTNLQFIDNKAARGGGMFFRVAGRGDITNYLTLTTSNFTNNEATTGAGLLIDDLQGLMEIIDTWFTGNVAGVAGGAVSLSRPLLGLSILRFQGSFISGNRAGVEGGGCSFLAASNVIFVHTHVVNNKAQRGGGVSCTSCDVLSFDLYGDQSAPRPQEVTSLWEEGESEKLTDAGEALESGSNSVDLGVSIVYSNAADDLGGGILCTDCGYIALGHVVFQKNNATTGGGVAIQNLQHASMVDVNGTAFLQNAAQPRASSIAAEIDAMGGAMWVGGATVLLSHIFLEGNAAAYGGGIAWALKALNLDTRRLTSLEIATDEALRALLVCPSIAASPDVSPTMDPAAFNRFSKLSCGNVLSDFVSRTGQEQKVGVQGSGAMVVDQIRATGNLASGGGGGVLYVDNQMLWHKEEFVWPAVYDVNGVYGPPPTKDKPTRKRSAKRGLLDESTELQSRAADVDVDADADADTVDGAGARDVPAFVVNVPSLAWPDGGALRELQQSSDVAQPSPAPSLTLHSRVTLAHDWLRNMSSDTSAAVLHGLAIRVAISGAGNRASYGPFIATAGVHVHKAAPGKVRMQSNTELKDVIELYDMLGQQVKVADGNFYHPALWVSSVPRSDASVALEGNQEALVGTNGSITFPDVTVLGIPKREYDLQFQLFNRSKAEVGLQLLGCHIGQLQRQKRAQGGIDYVDCIPCEVDGFSYNPANQTCDLCDQESTWCMGQYKTWPRAGHWQSSWSSSTVHKCQNEEACTWPNEGDEGWDALIEQYGLDVEAILKETELPFVGENVNSSSGEVLDEQAVGGILRNYVLYQCKVLSIEALRSRSDIDAVVFDEGGTVPKLQGHYVQIPHTNIQCTLHPNGTTTFATGQHDFVNLQCAPGYEGHLCGSCNRDRSKGPMYSLEEPFECTECYASAAWVAGSVIATAFFIFLTTFFTMYSNQKDTGTQAGVSDVVKAMIFFIQTLSIITQIDVDIPEDLRSFSSALNSMYSPSNAFACVLDTPDHWDAALWTTLIRLAVPFGIFAGLSPLWLLYSRQLHSRFRKMLTRSSQSRPRRARSKASSMNLTRQETGSSYDDQASGTVSDMKLDDPPAVEHAPVVPSMEASNYPRSTSGCNGNAAGPAAEACGSSPQYDASKAAVQVLTYADELARHPHRPPNRSRQVELQMYPTPSPRQATCVHLETTSQTCDTNDASDSCEGWATCSAPPTSANPLEKLKQGAGGQGGKRNLIRNASSGSNKSVRFEDEVPQTLQTATAARSSALSGGSVPTTETSPLGRTPSPPSPLGEGLHKGESPLPPRPHEARLPEVQEVPSWRSRGEAQPESGLAGVQVDSANWRQGVAESAVHFGTEEEAPASRLRHFQDSAQNGGLLGGTASNRSRMNESVSSGQRPSMEAQHSDIFAQDFEWRSRRSYADIARRLRSGRRVVMFGFEAKSFHELLVLLINTITFFYPTLMEIVLSVFVCNTVDSADGPYHKQRHATAAFGYWYMDMYTPCFVGRHLYLTIFVGVLGSIFICIGLPVLVWFLLNRARTSPHSKSREQLMFLSHPFHDRHYYWECVRMLQLFAMIALKVAGVTLSELVQIELLQLVIAGFIVLLVSVRPQRFKLIFYLELYTFCANFVGVFLISLVMLPESEFPKQGSEAVVKLSMVLYVLAFLPFVYVLVRKFGPVLQLLVKGCFSNRLCAVWGTAACCSVGGCSACCGSGGVRSSEGMNVETGIDCFDFLDTVFECCFL